MPVVWTIKENCQRCYSCIRECPARAIKVEGGQARVLPERCIGCGHCVTVCSQNAKEILSGIEVTRYWLQRAREGSQMVAALIAPSFPAAFPDFSYKKLVGALKKLGFSKVVEVASGAELINLLYRQAVEEKSEWIGKFPIITSTCPALVEYVEKYCPELIPHLATVVSPMVATAKAVRHLYGPAIKTVFIGPCIAKKKERQREGYADLIHEALTFVELKNMLESEGINPSTIEEAEFDEPTPGLARLYPIPGGLIRSAELPFDILDNSIVFAEGKQDVLHILDDVRKGEIDALLVDLLFCEGCINGPAIGNQLNKFTRKQRVVEYTRSRSVADEKTSRNETLIDQLDLRTEFRYQDQRIPEPSEEEIRQILHRIRKESAEKELNCGACGYETCREFARAVHKELAEEEMCLPYLIETLEQTHHELEQSLQELKTTQEQLIHSEKLASLGQLAAGVAHEINNPLGSIILFAHLLMQQLEQNEQVKGDLKMIVEEATRCKNIVSGLLDFARQGNLTLSEIEPAELIRDVLRKLKQDPTFQRIQIKTSIDKTVRKCMLDRDQFTQLLLNLLYNARDALQEKQGDGQIHISLSFDRNHWLNWEIRDNGIGIPEEHRSKLFTPFFTTKPPGKGTGLGLPIVYGIVKMHKGSISIDSRVGEGTCVTIKIPCMMKKGESYE